jgi:rRNA-processing protein FCF1
MATDRIRNTKVILDTNAVLMPFQFKINLDSELKRLLGQYEIILPSIVIEELNNLAAGPKPPREIKSALSLASRYEQIPVASRGDAAVFELAEKYNAIVVTNDKELKHRLIKAGIKTISLKSRTHLILNEY